MCAYYLVETLEVLDLFGALPPHSLVLRYLVHYLGRVRSSRGLLAMYSTAQKSFPGPITRLCQSQNIIMSDKGI
jgi:hypothetical protein